jgi:hypothetical protein
MTKIISLSLLTLGSLLYADMSTQEFIYKDSRIMGAGGANTAVGGYSTSLFYNPAGLINIKKSHGMEVELLGLGVVTSGGTQAFINDISDANTTDEITTITKKYSGDAFNVGTSNYSSFSYRTDGNLAYSIGVLAASDINLIPHANGGSNGVLETHSRVYGGVMLGAAYELENTLPGKLTLGIGMKYIQQKSYDVGLTAVEIEKNQDDLATYIQDTYEVDNSGFGVDLGVLYSPAPQSTLNPSFAISVLNLGSLNFEDAYGSQPMTLNFGVAIAPEVSWLNSFSLAIDYVDALNAQQIRIRNYNPAYSADQYDNADKEYEALQHVRVGASAGLVDNSWFLLTLNGGLYQGAYTAGIDTQLAILSISAATYQEQLGAKSGQLEDRRYMLNLGIGW